MMDWGGGSHREDRIAKEQQGSTVSMCFVPQGFTGQWLGPWCYEVERLWTPKQVELARSLGMSPLGGIDIVIVGA